MKWEVIAIKALIRAIQAILMPHKNPDSSKCVIGGLQRWTLQDLGRWHSPVSSSQFLQW